MNTENPSSHSKTSTHSNNKPALKNKPKRVIFFDFTKKIVIIGE